jgi:1-phosphofructokinase
VDGTEVAVFAPATTLSMTIERTAELDELHVHPAGQGYWVSRMLRVLGCAPLLCTPLGGETGVVLRALLCELPDDGLVDGEAANGSYIHDRRDGERTVLAEVGTTPLTRHTLDDLVSVTLACALRARVLVVCGTNLLENVSPDVYARVCADARATGTKVVADLSGAELCSALEGGIDVLKLSHTEMIEGGWGSDDSESALVAGIGRLVEAGAHDVVVSRAADGALARVGGTLYSVRTPELSVVDHRGAGDSMTAALAASTARGLGWPDALRTAASAAAVNVTRHGLSSGNADAIAALSGRVELQEL